MWRTLKTSRPRMGNPKAGIGRATSLLTAALMLLMGITPIAAAEPSKEKPETPASAPLLDRNHHLGPGDVIEVTVVDVESLSGPFRLYADGSIEYPLLGVLQAAGLTTSELQTRLTQALAKKELRKPNVRVVLKEIYTPPAPVKATTQVRVTVLGAAAKLGELEFSEPKPLRALLAEVAPTDKADLKSIRVRYPDGSARVADFSQFKRTGDAVNDVLLKGGEEVILLERADLPPPPEPAAKTAYVRIAGQVATPGQFELKPGMSLEDLIIGAGKLTLVADIEKVELRRGGQARTVDLLAQQKLGLDGQIALEPGDQVQIPEKKDIVTLVGAIPTPGRQALKPGQTLRSFIIESGVATQLNPSTLDLKATQLMRPGQAEAMKLDVQAVLKKPGHKDNVVLKSGDLLFFSPREQKQRRGILEYLSVLSPLSILFGGF